MGRSRERFKVRVERCWATWSPPLTDSTASCCGLLLSLQHFIKEHLTQDACFEVGVEPSELMPKKLKDFKTEENRAIVLPVEVQKQRLEHYESRRLWKLAIVLKAREEKQEEKTRAEEKLKHDEDVMVRMYDEFLKKEAKRNAHISSSQAKVREVLLKENEQLIKRREAFNKRFEGMTGVFCFLTSTFFTSSSPSFDSSWFSCESAS